MTSSMRKPHVGDRISIVGKPFTVVGVAKTPAAARRKANELKAAWTWRDGLCLVLQPAENYCPAAGRECPG